MLLIPTINLKGNLSLDAFSFSSSELNSVAYVIEKSEITFKDEFLLRDNQGRMGIRFFIFAQEIIKLERTLSLKFFRENDSTFVKLDFQSSGSSFRCQRIDTPPSECETIYANDENEATVKCALVANSNNWLGGVARLGRCEY